MCYIRGLSKSTCTSLKSLLLATLIQSSSPNQKLARSPKRPWRLDKNSWSEPAAFRSGRLPSLSTINWKISAIYDTHMTIVTFYPTAATQVWWKHFLWLLSSQSSSRTSAKGESPAMMW